jgi:serine/threonine protein kinase
LGHGNVILKRVDQEEEELHEFLANLKDPHNRTIPLLNIASMLHGTFLVMPIAIPLSDFDPTMIKHELGIQLLDGVKFMHRNYIAHLDLKPDNLVVVRDVLHIIDFGLACRVSSYEDVLEGFRGTKPWVAPEEGEQDGPEQTFNPIAADLWATGRILKYLSGFMESRESDLLMVTARQLMHEDPTQRLLSAGYIYRGVKRRIDNIVLVEIPTQLPSVKVH